ncbi:dihydropteroate synthase [Spirochaetia bacterium 38H-sp]|uniref:dihydropteroate synthase n=1 Tax=Rarispira pelagica TaxID=3141764 RepID=A0ABU9UDQ1_9SPIR
MSYIELASGKRLSYSKSPLIMGIVNVTPDSFFAGSRALGIDAAERALAMVEQGADIIDVGGESTRPGSDYVRMDEELERVVPVVEEIRKRSDVPISVDTRKAEVARAALDAGADVINDVSALEDDEALAALVAQRGVPVVLMHKKGTPKDMQNNPYYDNAVAQVLFYLLKRAEYAVSCGIDRSKIIIDPGFGFGKRVEDNIALLRNADVFVKSGYPVLIGLSRKSFIGFTVGRDVEDRLAGTLACHYHAADCGVAILRVHDVAETRDLLFMREAIKGASGGGTCWKV